MEQEKTSVDAGGVGSVTMDNAADSVVFSVEPMPAEEEEKPAETVPGLLRLQALKRISLRDYAPEG